jgi:8-oxo-dGTP pyrophosphatase MutT (NUDIX family)
VTRVRRSVRVILLNPNREFLLFLSHFEPGSGLDPAWVFPGGGIEPGETDQAAAVREIFEETGLELDLERFRESVAQIAHPMPDIRFFDSGEATFFVLELTSLLEVKSDNWTADEHRDTVGYKWWSMSEVSEIKPWIEPFGSLEILERVLSPKG